MKKVSIYTRSGQTSPSSYYRVLQFVPALDARVKCHAVVPDGIYAKYNKSKRLRRLFYQVAFYAAANFRLTWCLLGDLVTKPNVLFINRAISPRILMPHIGWLLKIVTKKTEQVIWDIDDNVFENGEVTKREASILFQNSTVIIVIGRYLKSLLPEAVHDKVIFLPTTDGDYQDEDIPKLIDARKQRYEDGEIALLWLATYTSLPFVEDVVPYLDEAAKEIKAKYNKQLTLEIVCNRPLEMRTEHLNIVNYTWTKSLAREKMLGAHIGIMPTRYSAFTLGKGGFKMIQYMSAGLPTLASAVGYTCEIMHDRETGILISYEELQEWKSATLELCESWEKISKTGLAARRLWEEGYSYAANLAVLKERIEDEE